MKNKSIDLNNHLFAQLERLGSEDLKGDALKAEIARSKAMANVAHNVIDNARLNLEAQKALEKDLISAIPAMIGNDEHE